MDPNQLSDEILSKKKEVGTIGSKKKEVDEILTYRYVKPWV